MRFDCVEPFHYIVQSQDRRLASVSSILSWLYTANKPAVASNDERTRLRSKPKECLLVVDDKAHAKTSLSVERQTYSGMTNAVY